MIDTYEFNSYAFKTQLYPQIYKFLVLLFSHLNTIVTNKILFPASRRMAEDVVRPSESAASFIQFQREL